MNMLTIVLSFKMFDGETNITLYLDAHGKEGVRDDSWPLHFETPFHYCRLIAIEMNISLVYLDTSLLLSLSRVLSLHLVLAPENFVALFPASISSI